MFQLLADFVAFPSISAEEKHREDCRRCAHFLQKAFVSLGAESDLVSCSLGHLRARLPELTSTISYRYRQTTIL